MVRPFGPKDIQRLLPVKVSPVPPDASCASRARVKPFEKLEQVSKLFVFTSFSEEKKGGANKNVPNFRTS